MKTANALSIETSLCFMFDPLWLVFAIPGLLLGIWAQIKLSHAYGKYSRVPVDSGMTGAEAAREILDRAGLVNVPVEEIPGHLSDHYDPTKRALFLSSENFHGQTVAAVGVAAHESGHALQHQAAYGMFNLRMAHGAGDAIREHGLHGHFLRRALFSGLFSDNCICASPSDFFRDDAVSACDAAGGIRREPPREGAIVPARPRA